MFKYPLAVTIDTNIFDAAKFDLCDASPLKTLENYVKNGKIKVVLSDIVVRESKRHIADQIKKICGIMRKARAAALEESTEHLISTIGLGEILRIVTNKGELISKGEEMFDDFLRTINTEILGADLIDVGLVLGDYFETKPPFENSEKKKSEFPDAFIAQQIRKRFGETEEVVIISKVFPFTVILGGDSRRNRYEVEEHPVEDDEEEIRDMDREALGFQALGSYESYLEDNLPESHFYADIIARFEKINGLYRKYDDCCISFDDLLAELNTANSKEIIKLIYERLLEVSDIPHIANIENITDSDIEEIQAWANAQYKRVSEIADINALPDVMSFGETIVIKGIDSSKASLSIGDNQISPDEGSEEVIDICFSNGDENTTSGYIKLTVGYLNFDEDGGAADGISDEVEYEYHDILKELDNFIYAQNCLIEKDTRIAEIISEAIKTNGDNT